MQIQKKYYHLLLFILLVCCCTTGDIDPVYSQNEIYEYFSEIVLEDEYGDYKQRIVRRWENDIYLYLEGDPKKEIIKEIDVILSELNALMQTVQIHMTKEIDKANVIVFFGSMDEYQQIEPRATNLLDSDLGFFWVDFDQNYKIFRGSIFVDLKNSMTYNVTPHVLREEITQALGLFNDSYTYPDSIFYQGWSTIAKFSDIDRILISLLYAPECYPGMNQSIVNQMIGNKFPNKK